MKLLITIIFFIIGVKINAMNLLDYKVDEKKLYLKIGNFFLIKLWEGVRRKNISKKTK